MKQKLIGTYTFFDQDVDLVAILDDSGGCFRFTHKLRKIPRIEVGLNYDTWREVVSTLLHECIEFVLTRKGLRYNRCGKFNNDHADYLFAFDHPQFSDMCSRVAMFIAPALPDLAAAYNKNKKEKSKRK